MQTQPKRTPEPVQENQLKPNPTAKCKIHIREAPLLSHQTWIKKKKIRATFSILQAVEQQQTNKNCCCSLTILQNPIPFKRLKIFLRTL